jgi:hypothetical protein
MVINVLMVGIMGGLWDGMRWAVRLAIRFRCTPLREAVVEYSAVLGVGAISTALDTFEFFYQCSVLRTIFGRSDELTTLLWTVSCPNPPFEPK